MRRIFHVVLAISLIATLSAVQSCQSTKTSAGKLLKFNLENGKTYDFEIVWDVTQETGNQDMKISVAAGYSVNITNDDGNIKSIKAVYNDFKMHMGIMGMEINVDTDKPAPEVDTSDIKGNPAAMSAIMSKLFAGIKGKTFTMKVNQQGEVVDVSGFEEIANSIADSMSMPAEAKEKMKEMLKQRFNGEDIRKQFSQMFYIFPNKQVKIGDSWDKNLQFGDPGAPPVKYNSTYTVKEIEGDIVTLDAKTQIETQTEMVKLKGEQTGKLLVESKTGLVLSADFDQDIKTTVNGQSITLKGKGKIKGKER